MQPTNKVKQKVQSERQDISIMTLLANEATDDARKLLAKFGNTSATGYKDLEEKLGEVYFKTPNKVEMEREMVNIHPHKKWMLKYIAPKEKIKEVTKGKESDIDIEPMGLVSNADGSCDCPSCIEERSSACGCESSFDATHPTTTQPKKNHTPIIITSIVAVSAITIFGIYMYYKHKK